jgi:hypothetical protein
VTTRPAHADRPCAAGSSTFPPDSPDRNAARSCTYQAAGPALRDRVEDTPRSFAPGGRQTSDLLAYLSDLPYDGGTDLTALDLSSPAEAGCEVWLLFSDGLGTLHPGMPEIGDIPVVSVTGQAHCNAVMLQYVAQTTGGRYLNLLRSTTQAAVNEIVSGGQAVRIIESDGCEDVRAIVGQGRVAVLGRLTTEDASIRVAGLGPTTETVTVSRRGASDGDLVARA